MPNSEVVMALAKVMAAGAWVDGQVTNDELNSLKDLLFQIPEMSARDWAQIDIYLNSPVDEVERNRLVTELRAKLSSPADKDLALQALDQLIQIDATVSDSERESLEEIKLAIQDANTGITGRLGKLMRGRAQQHSRALASASNREIYLEDFVKNRVYYEVSQQVALEGTAWDIPDTRLRKLSLAGGLMARVAFVDREITEAEVSSLQESLEVNWELSQVEGAAVAEIAVSEVVKGLDDFRLAREFFECTTELERVRFLDVLFSVAVADGKASYEEVEEIRLIANILKLTHEQFIDAKLKIPGELRGYM